tara:strand:- start:758 stop:1654 length:897 start_codon:yes stop_codon:yes gene_type:complete
MPKVASALEKARKVASGLDPATLPTHVLNAVPTNLMYRKGINIEGRNRADVISTAQRGLNEGITTTDKGLAKVRKLKQEQLEKINTELKPLGNINAGELYAPLDDLRKRRNSVTFSDTPRQDMKVIDDVFLEHLADTSNNYPDLEIPATAVHEIKKTMSKAGEPAFGDYRPAAGFATKAAISRGAKEALEARSPNIRGLNKAMGELVNLEKTTSPSAIHRAESAALTGVDQTSRRLLGDTAGIVMSFLGRKSADVAIWVKGLRENPAEYVLARSALVQAGRTQDEADQELQRLIVEQE